MSDLRHNAQYKNGQAAPTHGTGDSKKKKNRNTDTEFRQVPSLRLDKAETFKSVEQAVKNRLSIFSFLVFLD